MSLDQILKDANSTPFHEKLNRRLHEALSREFSKWCLARQLHEESPAHACRFLREQIELGFDRLWLLDERYFEFRESYPLHTSESDRLEAVLELARQFGADERKLKGDRQAARKRWFGPDALSDRWRKRKLETQRRIRDLFKLWGRSLLEIASSGEVAAAWNRAGGSELFERLAQTEVDSRVRQAALSAVATAVSSLPSAPDSEFLDSRTVSLIINWSRDTQCDVWVQAEAQRVLSCIRPGQFTTLLTERLQNRGPGDDFFVRARLLHRLTDLESQGRGCWSLLQDVRQDPSEFVRQEACAALANSSSEAGLDWLRRFALEDPSPRVRSAALVALRSTVDREDWRIETVLDLVSEALSQERDDFVLRVAARVAGDWLAEVIEESEPTTVEEEPPELAAFCDRVRKQIIPQLALLRTTVESVLLRRQLALESERLWMLTTPRVRHVVDEIRNVWCTVPPGRARRFPRRYLDVLKDDLGRALAVLAQDDFGYDLERSWWGWRLRRGDRKTFRLWRFLYETWNPSPDKRQAHDHTVGRKSTAELRAPSALMSELSETKVPGEPLHMSHEGNWKPFLPLLDDVLSTVSGFGRRRPVRFFTSEGITTLTPPRSLIRRCIAFWRITLGFSKLAALRNWRPDSQHRPNEYVAALKRLGFGLSFTPYDASHPATDRDASVESYFVPLLIGLSILPDRLQQFLSKLLSYFHSPYQNSTWHLILFMAGIACLFLGRHLYLNWKFRRQRDAIPFSIGGWGTRGKSGTERLKAALFCGLGYNVVSKSTGCEAMFLLSPPMGRLTEFFLFRPYDKATIWEQLDVMELAYFWEADVFLWECMGLSPAYVEVLQRQWMRDDIATITNTYPDHEDLQGPSGADVARSIAGFVPLKSNAITTEREMRPLLEEAAREAGTRLKTVDWMESGLIAQDVLQRFSYEEHPDNIALVLALAAELNIPRDVAMKAMADELIADLGVLKTFPPATVQTRTIEFANGMSANERLGCLGNWKRLGFDRHEPADEAGVFVTTLVNNRADRVARSRVFAELIVNDLNADRHVLIGNNLKGMQGYIAQAWDRAIADLHLWPANGTDPSSEQVLEGIFRRHRWPTHEQHVKDRLAVMLESVLPESKQLSARAELFEDWDEASLLAERLQQLGVPEKPAAAVQRFHSESLTALAEYQEILSSVRSARPDEYDKITRRFHEMLKTWVQKKIVVVEDYHATGEQIIQRIVEATPPGFRNRVMGIQNIKGTGLDFVYRFQAWEECHALCRRLVSEDETKAIAALRELSQFPEFGLLSEEYVLDSIAVAEQRPAFADPQLRHELDRLKNRVANELDDLRESVAGDHRQSGWKLGVLAWIEQFLDLGDSVRRRKRAEQVYRDILDERISPDRAAAILRDLTRRQKGGWLAARFLNRSDNERSNDKRRDTQPSQS